MSGTPLLSSRVGLTPQLVLGIDPDPPHTRAEGHREGRLLGDGQQSALALFKQRLHAHEALLDAPDTRAWVHWLKPNLAFFLRHGSAGVELLEGFVDKYREAYFILLDAKFSEIENSLRGSLAFAFETLRVHGVTLNPFLGEGSIRLAMETCARAQGPKGRVHVLCRTSESSGGALFGLQHNWQALVASVAEQTRSVAAGDPLLLKLGGVVVGAGHRNVLLSKELRESELSVLAPGLGAQGASFSIVSEAAERGLREVLFPLSRGIFAAGEHTPAESASKLRAALAHFSGFGSTTVPPQISGDPT